MTTIKDLDFNLIKFSVVKKDTVKCYINYGKNKLDVEFPVSKVAFNVDFSYNRPNLSITLTEFELINFNNTLDQLIIESVYKNSKLIYGTQKTMEALEELYCSPHKIAPTGKKYYDLLQLKVNKNFVMSGCLNKNDRVKLLVQISGLWFSETSFGPYLNVIGVEKEGTTKKVDFIESDSEN
jgi:hypothetical protein